MKTKVLKKALFVITIYIIIAISFFFIAGEQLREKTVSTPNFNANGGLLELNNTIILEQEVDINANQFTKIMFNFTSLGYEPKGEIQLSLINYDLNTELAFLSLDTTYIENGYYEWILENPILKENYNYIIKLESSSSPGSGLGMYYTLDQAKGFHLTINGLSDSKNLCLSVSGIKTFWLGTHYWQCAVILGIILIGYGLYSLYLARHNKASLAVIEYRIWKKYKFLIKQLVLRDFKTKYKRSILGYLWSFLNPLLTMLIQYIVFSTIFSSDIKNFPVYLLTGIILFNFFNEAVGQGLTAITGNAALITKVYVPKYIYPVTKVMSSAINLIISMIPLLIMVAITGTKITPAILLLPYALICLIVFCIGMVLLLSAAMVFFRDTQYLWSIISLAWMYATPLFYPESIIPSNFRFIHRINPIYYIIKFARTLLIDGVSPEPALYGYCALFPFIIFLLGAIVFKKTQNKFVLYI